MDKSEYSIKISALEHTRQKALEFNRREVERVSKQYIAENCKFKVGDLVMLGDKKGRIESLSCDMDGDFYGEWRKVRTNGELFAKAHGFSPWDYVKMRKVED